jgi:hypothetical protein
MNKLLSRCPVCGGPVHVTGLGCDSCGTRISGDFEACRFCSLTQEQLQFVELFLRHRGNITSVGETLGISHPTVTRRLEAVIAGLDGALSDTTADGRRQTAETGVAVSAPRSIVAPDSRDEDRIRILEMLDRGEISADEATRRLSEL